MELKQYWTSIVAVSFLLVFITGIVFIEHDRKSSTLKTAEIPRPSGIIHFTGVTAEANKSISYDIPYDVNQFRVYQENNELSKIASIQDPTQFVVITVFYAPASASLGNAWKEFYVHHYNIGGPPKPVVGSATAPHSTSSQLVVLSGAEIESYTTNYGTHFAVARFTINPNWIFVFLVRDGSVKNELLNIISAMSVH